MLGYGNFPKGIPKTLSISLFACLEWNNNVSSFQTALDRQTDNLQVCVQLKWLFKAFSFCAATAQRGCPSDLTQSHGSWWGTGCIHIQLGRRKRGQDQELPPTTLVCSSISQQNYSVSQFSYKGDDSNLSSSSPSLQLLWLQIFYIFWKKYIENDPAFEL